GYASSRPDSVSNATCWNVSALIMVSLGLRSDNATKALDPRTIPFAGTTLPAVKPSSRADSSAFLSAEKLRATRASGMTCGTSYPGLGSPAGTPKKLTPAAAVIESNSVLLVVTGRLVDSSARHGSMKPA